LQTARTQRHNTYKPVPTKNYTILIFQARKENTKTNKRERKERGGGKKQEEEEE
jgi:hypothetical protein